MRKDIVITALLTFCLTATLFMVATTRSQEYDPWADLNEDGKIDILDVVGTTNIYGMSGDPTRNVNVTNWPPQGKTITLLENFNMTWNTSVGVVITDNFDLGTLDTRQFHRIRFNARITNGTIPGNASPDSAYVHISGYSVFEFGEILEQTSEIRWYWNSQVDHIEFITFQWDFFAPNVRIVIHGESYTPIEPVPASITCLVSLGAYLGTT